MLAIELKARNTFWNKDSEDFLKEMEGRAGNSYVKKYIKSTLRKYLDQEFPAKLTKTPQSKLPEWARGKDDVYELKVSRKDKTTLLHYVDYLNTLPERDIRLSFADLVKAVKAWEKELASGEAKAEDGVDTLYTYSDNFSWVKVTGKDSLDREGKLMQHCVGSYYVSVKKGRTSIYSLRDPHNKPHITIEIDAKMHLQQIKGKQNKAPANKYIKYLEDFLKRFERKLYKTIASGDLMSAGFITTNTGIINILSPDVVNEAFVDDTVVIDVVGNDVYLPKKLVCDEFELIYLGTSHAIRMPDYLEADTITIDRPCTLKDIDCKVIKIGYNADIQFEEPIKVRKLVLHGKILRLPEGSQISRLVLKIEDLRDDVIDIEGVKIGSIESESPYVVMDDKIMSPNNTRIQGNTVNGEAHIKITDKSAWVKYKGVTFTKGVSIYYDDDDKVYPLEDITVKGMFYANTLQEIPKNSTLAVLRIEDDVDFSNLLSLLKKRGTTVTQSIIISPYLKDTKACTYIKQGNKWVSISNLAPNSVYKNNVHISKDLALPDNLTMKGTLYLTPGQNSAVLKAKNLVVDRVVIAPESKDRKVTLPPNLTAGSLKSSFSSTVIFNKNTTIKTLRIRGKCSDVEGKYSLPADINVTELSITFSSYGMNPLPPGLSVDTAILTCVPPADMKAKKMYLELPASKSVPLTLKVDRLILKTKPKNFEQVLKTYGDKVSIKNLLPVFD